MREEPNLVSILKELRTELDDIKTAQKLAGDGWIFYRNTTGNLPDISFPSGGSGTFRYQVTFTPDTDDNTAAELTRLWEADLGATRIYTIRPQNFEQNIWYFVIVDPSNNTRVTFTVNSTQKGTVSVVSI